MSILTAEIGTFFSEHRSLLIDWLPKRHRVGPSASLDE
jgi:hypothetical protein